MTEPVRNGPADDARRRPGQLPARPYGLPAGPAGAAEYLGGRADDVPSPRGPRSSSAADPYRDASPYQGGGDPYREASPYQGGGDPYREASPYQGGGDPYREASPYQGGGDPYREASPYQGGGDPYREASPYQGGGDPYREASPYQGGGDPYREASPYQGGGDPYPQASPHPDEQPWLGASMPPTGRRGSAASGRQSGPAAGVPSAAEPGAGPGFEPGPRAGRLGRRGPGSRRKLRPGRPQTPMQAAVGAVTEVVVVLAMALALSLLIKTFLVQAFYIPSQSMEDTLMIGDRVLVSKLTPGPFSLEHGDVIVFKDPGNWLDPVPQAQEGPVREKLRAALTFVGLLPQDSGEHLIKRVIGLPGDTVTCCDARGRLMVNGVPIDETYIRAGNEPSQDKFTVTVQKDHLWVMGDNRSQSADSRFHRKLNDGQVPISDVVGKAFVVVWPFSRFGGVSEPPQVFSGVPAAASP